MVLRVLCDRLLLALDKPVPRPGHRVPKRNVRELGMSAKNIPAPLQGGRIAVETRRGVVQLTPVLRFRVACGSSQPMVAAGSLSVVGR